MSGLVMRPEVQVIALAVFLSVFLLVVLAVTVAKFYRRCGADEALVRTGAGGNKVVLGGGITVYPILHQLLRVSLRSHKLSVERSDKNALVTKDKIKANVTTELYVKVEPLAEDVLAAARSFGERSLDERAIATLIEGKLTDALRSVAANQTFMDLHSQRKQFAEHIQNALSEELKKNGLTLENVSITAFAMVPVGELDPRDVFDAEGLRTITESVQSNAEKTNQVKREKEIAIRLQDVEAKKRSLALEQDQSKAEADQARSVAEYAATQRAATAQAVFVQEQAAKSAEIATQKVIETQLLEKRTVLETAEIERQRVLEAATVQKQSAIEAAEVEKEKTVETARIGKEIAVAEAEAQKARASAQKAHAEAEREAARQAIVTVEETARANREKSVAVIKAEEDAETARIAAEREASMRTLEAEAVAEAARRRAQGEADALKSLAEATVKRGEADAEAKRLLIEADNAVASRLLLRDVALKALEVLPVVTKELMAPAQAIREIKVLQVQGANATNGDGTPTAASGAFGAASPILKTILEAGAAYPLFRELLQFSQADTAGLADKARALLGQLPSELREVVSADPELSAKLGIVAPSPAANESASTAEAS